jgi:predicted molibdopterin-dependent oxidoreductase YjgC
MMQDLRIPTVRRKERLQIQVNGKPVTAYRGETVFAALQAAHYNRFKRSKSLAESRGALCGMGVCFGCLVTINGVRNQRSCMTEVEDRMEVEIDET